MGLDTVDSPGLEELAGVFIHWCMHTK